MALSESVRQNFEEHGDVSTRTLEALEASIIEVGELLARCLADGGTVYWCGNGGSAADSQHIAAELVGRFKQNRRPLRSVALTTDTSVLTCVANDFGYDDIFSRQVEALAKPGDVLVGISTSGNSENVNRAFKAAATIDVITIGLLGKGGGPSKALVDHALIVPSETTSRIQEMHILIGHIFCELVEGKLSLC